MLQQGISSIKYNNQHRTSQDLPYLAGVIGERIGVEITFYWEDLTFAREDNDIICNPPAALVGSYASLNQLIYVPNENAFADFKVGDTLDIQGSANGNNGSGFQVLEVISPNLIRVLATFNYEILPWGAGAFLYRSNELRVGRYLYNLIDSGFNFTSLIDGETQKLQIPYIATGVYNYMAFTGINSYQIGNAQIRWLGLSSGRFTYQIYHYTYITPFFLANQWSSLVAHLKPSYFDAANCLKHVFQIRLTRNFADPTGEQVLNYNQPANTGWFNENFNGGTNYYSISQFNLVRNSDSAPLTQLEFSEIVDFTIKIKNTTTNPFSNGNTKFTLNFMYLPESAAMYQNNGRTMEYNFVFDRCFFTLGGAAAVGELPGSYKVIKTVSAAFNSSSEITLTGQFEIGTLAQGIMTEGDFSRYAIWVTTENHALAAGNSDRVALLVSVSEIFQQTVEADLIENETLFIKHPYTDVADGEPSTEVFPTDDIAARSDFSIDFTGRESDNIRINKINTRVYLTNGVDPDIILDDFVLNTNAYPLIGSLFQNINFQQNRIYNIPAGEIRKVIDVQNNFAADSGLVHNWYINFPFMVRWEYFLALVGLASPPTGIFDTGEPLNGINNFWHRMTTVAGWQLKYYVKFFFEQKGSSATQTFESPIISHNYDDNPDWDNESISSYSRGTAVVITAGPLVVGDTYTINTYVAGDDFTNVGGANVSGTVFTATGTTPTNYTNGSTLTRIPNTLLTYGGNKYFESYQNTRIVASFEWVGGGTPLLSDIEFVMWIERYESSGVAEVRRISSVYAIDSGSWFLSIDGTDKILKQKNGNVFTAEALINNSLLPTASKYTVYARLYHKPTFALGDKQFQNADYFDFQDSIPYSFQ